MLSQNLTRFRSRMLLWFVLGSGCLLVMLTHQSTPVEYFGRYSQRYVLLLGFVLLTVLIAGALLIISRLTQVPVIPIRLPNTRPLGWLVVIAEWVVLGVLWLTIQPSSRSVPGI